MDPEKIKAALEALKNGDGDAAIAILQDLIVIAASGGEAPPVEDTGAIEPLGETAEPPPEEEEVPEELMRLSGMKSQSEAIALFKALLVKSAETATNDRLALVAELVKLGAETPATAWSGKPEARVPVRRLSDEPIEELRTRVTALKAAKPSKPRPPERVDAAKPDPTKLSKHELEACKARGLDPADYAARKADAVRRSP